MFRDSFGRFCSLKDTKLKKKARKAPKDDDLLEVIKNLQLSFSDIYEIISAEIAYQLRPFQVTRKSHWKKK
jgi:hypothetical protein